MKKILCTAIALGGTLLMGAGPAAAVSSETEILLQLLQTKGVISQADAQNFRTTIDKKMAESEANAPEHHHTIQGMAKRLDKLEQATLGHPSEEGLANKVKLSGVMEVNATAGRTEKKDGTADETSDVALSTAELDADVAVNKHVSGHIAFLYEEDDPTKNHGSGIGVDEGIINLEGGEQMPVYLRAGKMYLPFGYYNSHFITDPLTLTLGRTKDTAVIGGYNNSVFDVNAGIFKGAVKETGDDSKIDSFVGSATYTMPKSTIAGLDLVTGLSYTSNLAASDTLQDKAPKAPGIGLVDTTGGYSAFVHLEYLEKYTFDAEYLGAIEDFSANDISFMDADNNKPASWNFEMAATIIPKLEAALRYGGSSDTGAYDDIAMPQSQMGGALLYDLLDDTSVTFEYLHDEYKNETNDDLATLQLAVEF